MEVLYHIRPYFVGIFPYIALKSRPYNMVGTSNQSVPEMAINMLHRKTTTFTQEGVCVYIYIYPLVN